jgi:hypothetical protein
MKPYGYVRADGKGLFIYGDHQFTNNQDHDLVPVYTHPKEWVGLTNEEFAKCWHSNPDKAMKNVDAKLKEKNSA